LEKLVFFHRIIIPPALFMSFALICFSSSFFYSFSSKDYLNFFWLFNWIKVNLGDAGGGGYHDYLLIPFLFVFIYWLLFHCQLSPPHPPPTQLLVFKDLKYFFLNILHLLTNWKEISKQLLHHHELLESCQNEKFSNESIFFIIFWKNWIKISENILFLLFVAYSAILYMNIHMKMQQHIIQTHAIPKLNYLSSLIPSHALSIFSISGMISLGFTLGLANLCTFPSGPTRNFAKFQGIYLVLPVSLLCSSELNRRNL